MKNLYISLSLAATFLALSVGALSQNRAGFEDLQLDPDAYWNGISASYGDYTTLLEDSIFLFKNRFSRNDYGFGLYDSWFGFAYSHMKDDTTAGIGNQYSAIAGSGALGSENYGVYYLLAGMDTIELTRPMKLDSVFITNGTYPYLSMRDGDSFSKKFGGETGDDPDWFLLAFVGIRDGQVTDTVKFYLADYRDANNDNDYIVSDWQKVDLSVLDTVDRVEVSLSSSDVGDWGMNTPAYFCLDNFSGADFEDLEYVSGDYWNGSTALIGNYHSEFSDGNFSFPNYYSINDYGTGLMESWTGFAYSNTRDDSTAGYSNQYSAITAGGAGNSWQYGLCYNLYQRDTVYLNEAGTVSGMFVTNGTLDVQSMLNGDGFAKKFGGDDGNDPDWFLLTIRGLYNDTCTDTVSYYLADYRFDNNEEDYIVTDWEWVDLTSMDTVDRLEFSLTSSDSGPYGMNTPAFFFFDDINDQLPVISRALRDTAVTNMINTEVVIDLNGVFSDPDPEDQIGLDVESINGDNIAGETSITDGMLTLQLTQTTGSAEITVKATSGGHTLTDSFTLTVIQYEAIDITYNSDIQVFPNPTTGMLTIGSSGNNVYKLKVFDSYGHLLLAKENEISTSEIDISDFSTGIYFIEIITDKGSIIKTIHKN